MENSYDFNNNDFSNVNFIYCKQYRQGYYYYGMNDIEHLICINKNDLQELLILKLGVKNMEDLEYCLSRNLPFIFDNNSKEIKKFKIITNKNKEIEREKLINELKISSITSGLKSTHQNYFTKLHKK